MAHEHDNADEASVDLWSQGVAPFLALWRVNYIPGEWLLAAGPHIVVMLRPAANTRAEQLDGLWADVLADVLLDELIDGLDARGLDGVNDIAVAETTADGVRCLLRGAVQVVDVDSGQEFASGGSTSAWCDVLPSSSHLCLLSTDDLVSAVDPASPDDPALSDDLALSDDPASPDGSDEAELMASDEIVLPLVAGVAHASRVAIDIRPESLARPLRVPPVTPVALAAPAGNGAVVGGSGTAGAVLAGAALAGEGLAGAVLADDGQAGDAHSDAAHDELNDGDIAAVDQALGGQPADDRAAAGQAADAQPSEGRDWGMASPEAMREMGLAPDGNPLPVLPGEPEPVVAPADGGQKDSPNAAADPESAAGLWDAPPMPKPWFEESTGFAVGMPTPAESFMFEETEVLADKQAMPVVNPPMDEPEPADAASVSGSAPVTGGADMSAETPAATPAVNADGVGLQHGSLQPVPSSSPVPSTGVPSSNEESVDSAPSDEAAAPAAQGPDDVAARTPDEPVRHSFAEPEVNPFEAPGVPTSDDPQTPVDEAESLSAGESEPHVIPDFASDAGAATDADAATGAASGDDQPQVSPSAGTLTFDAVPDASMPDDSGASSPEDDPAAVGPEPDPAEAVNAEPAPAAESVISEPMPDLPVTEPEQHSLGIEIPPQPQAFTVIAENGANALLDRPLVVGRAPRVTDPRVGTMKVSSPAHDISRNHLYIEQHELLVTVTDMDSMNGTTVMEPDQEPVHLGSGATMTVPAGTVMQLATGEEIRIEQADA